MFTKAFTGARPAHRPRRIDVLIVPSIGFTSPNASSSPARRTLGQLFRPSEAEPGRALGKVISL
jgi:hypothetical protein